MNRAIVNTTFYVEKGFDIKFLWWVKNVYLADVKPLEGKSVAKILTQTQEGTTSYAVRLEARTLVEAMSWQENVAAPKLEKLAKVFGQHILHFTTFMEEVSLNGIPD